MKELDARGQLCPKPVMMARELVLAGEREFVVLVDNDVAVSNVSRFLENEAYSVSRSGQGSDFKIQAVRAETGTADAGASPSFSAERKGELPAAGDRSFMILSEYIGDESNGLGEVLMKSFLGTLASGGALPVSLALMNSGVKLALAESSCSDVLKDLASSGVKILVCGTCTKHYGITERIVVGQISNMFEITESVFSASKPIVMG